MNNVLKVFAVMATLSFSVAAMAKDPTTQPTGKAAGLHGKVQSVDGMVITIKNKSGGATIQTDANTTFTLDGAPATLADVKEGERVLSATPMSGVATEVKLVSAKKKKDKTPTTVPSAS